MVKWKIDDAPNLPLAVIEDTEDGDGVCEVANPEYWPRRDDAPEESWKIAREIVRNHNTTPDLLKACKNTLSALETPKDLTPDELRYVMENCHIAITASEEGGKE